MKKHSKIAGGILLVSGTTIGAGMLALPVSTGLAGFCPSILLLMAYWAFMLFTAYLILEVNLWMDGHANIITMAKRTLGSWGRAISWVVYLFLLYALTTAYIAGSSPLFIDFIQNLFGIKVPDWVGPMPLLIIFGFFVYQGTRSVDYANRVLMGGLILTYLCLVIFLTPHVESSLLAYANWKFLSLGVSVVATSFGFHIIIPILTTYLERDINKLRIVIFIGSIIPLAVYLLWELLTLGIIPISGPHGLAEGYLLGTNGALLLTEVLQQSWISSLSRAFSFFAIVTSFLGVSLSLTDFLADGLNIKKNQAGRVMLYLLTFIPPLLFTWTDPRAFLSALEFAGAFGVIILLGLLPACMVWKGRYQQLRLSPFQAPGGKVALIVCIVISCLVIVLEIGNKLSLFK